MTEAEWAVSFEAPRMIAALRGKGSERLWRLYAVACVRRTAHLMRDARSRKALEVAERFADGAATEVELNLARTRAEAAAHQALYEEYIDEVRANFCWDAEFQAVWEARRAAETALLCLAEDIGKTFDGQTTEIADTLQDPDLLRELFGNPFRWKLLDPAWLACNDGAAGKVARAIYDNHEFNHLPILADALEEAGCSDADILAHSRQPGEHARGCWVLDLVLGKE
jgi:hypothetical protein